MRKVLIDFGVSVLFAFLSIFMLFLVNWILVSVTNVGLFDLIKGVFE